MKKYETVKKKDEFSDIINNGHYVKNKYFVLYKKKSNNKIPLFGIAISNNNGNAVIRNKLKRRVRHLISQNKNLFQNSYKYIIMIRKLASDIDFKNLSEEFVDLLKKENK